MGDFDIKLCMDNGERLARIETIVQHIAARKPCEDCQNVASIVGMKQNLKIINWVCAIVTSAGLVRFSQLMINFILGHGDKLPPLG